MLTCLYIRCPQREESQSRVKRLDGSSCLFKLRLNVDLFLNIWHPDENRASARLELILEIGANIGSWIPFVSKSVKQYFVARFEIAAKWKTILDCRNDVSKEIFEHSKVSLVINDHVSIFECN